MKMQRCSFEMTDAQLERLLTACRPVPYLVMGGTEPRSQQENANAAWRDLSYELGFVWDTVEPDRRGDRYFSAIPAPRVFLDGNAWCAVGPDFVNLQESPASFGDTPDEARAVFLRELP